MAASGVPATLAPPPSGGARPEDAFDDPEDVLAAILDPQRRGELYPLYHAMRALSPIHHTSNERLHHAWVLTRFDDSMQVYLNPQAINDPATAEIYRNGGSEGAFYQTMRAMMLFLDSPEHDRLRRLVIRSFTPRAIERLRPLTQAVADELADAVATDGEMELVSQYAYPLPIRVIAHILGIPPSDHGIIEALAWDFARAGDPSALTPEIVRKGDDAALGFQDYFGRMIHERRLEPRDDVLSALVSAEEDGVGLSRHEIVATAVLLMQAGHETTADLIGNSIIGLLRHPDQLALLQREPELTKVATEEFLRYDGSVQVNHRLLREDMRLGDVVIPAGDVALIFLGAANRDPARFAEPDRLDVRRAPAPHLALSYGAYYCVGASLARTEVHVGVRTLVERFGGLDAASEAFQWRNTLTLRGPAELHLRWDR